MYLASFSYLQDICSFYQVHENSFPFWVLQVEREGPLISVHGREVIRNWTCLCLPCRTLSWHEPMSGVVLLIGDR